MKKIANISHVNLSGGGAKGIAYLGILRYLYLEEMIDQIKYISGTSIGALFAIIFALKIPSEFIEEGLEEIRKNMHIHSSLNKSNMAKLFTHNGIISAKYMVTPIVEYLKKKYDVTDLTFIEFVKKTGVNLYIRTTNLNTGKVQIFCLEDTPNVSVIDACIASMSVPFIAPPVMINGEYYIDGLTSDFDYFKDVSQQNVLNIMLPSDDPGKPLPKGSHIDLFDYSYRITQIMLAMMLKDSGQENPSLFKVGPLAYDSYFRFKCTDKDMFIEFNKEEFDSMIIQGFVYMSQYMNNRFSAAKNKMCWICRI
jgi:hypothetical protein